MISVLYQPEDKNRHSIIIFNVPASHLRLRIVTASFISVVVWMARNSTDSYSRTMLNFIDIVGLLYTIFVSSHMYPENHEGTRVIVGSMDMGYVSTLPGLALWTWDMYRHYQD